MSNSYLIENAWYLTASKLKSFKSSPLEYHKTYNLELSEFNKNSEALFIWTALDDYVSYWENFFYKKYEILEEWKRKSSKSDKLQLNQSQYNLIKNMIYTLKINPIFEYWNNNYDIQYKVETIFEWVKVKWTLDRFDKSNNLIRDLKTTADLWKFDKDIRLWDTFWYKFSLSFYAWLLHKKDWIECDAILDVIDKSSIPRYWCYKYNYETLKENFDYIELLIKQFKQFDFTKVENELIINEIILLWITQ